MFFGRSLESARTFFPVFKAKSRFHPQGSGIFLHSFQVFEFRYSLNSIYMSILAKYREKSFLVEQELDMDTAEPFCRHPARGEVPN